MSLPRILLLEDEVLILMDLEDAFEDAGFRTVPATSLNRAYDAIDAVPVDAAVLDVNLGGGETCAPVARVLDERNIPYVIHSGDLDRQGELVRRLSGRLIAKPSSSDRVVEEVAKLLAEKSDTTAS